MKRTKWIFVIIVFLVGVLQSAFPQNTRNGISTVVIDAGHGGRDPGALGKNSREKDIALSIALKTGNYIEKYLKDVTVIYTRKSDVFVELYKRAQIANENQADFFISIHCNSSKSSKPFGAETYVMGLHKSEQNLEVAQTENAAILLESDYSEQYEGFDPNSPEAYIVFSLYQNIFLDQSLDLAKKVQDQFRERVGRNDRGVKQAGFLVLYKTTMPGVLVEVGYLSNPAEEKFLLSQDGQVYLASAVYRAFKEFKLEYESKYNETKIPEKINIAPPAPQKKAPALFFRVQFLASPDPVPPGSEKFKGINDVKEYFHNGLYKYTTGNEASPEDALNLRNNIVKKDFTDAFVVAFYNETRITIEEAKKIISH